MIGNGLSQNWWKVVSSCLLQYKPVCVINFDKLHHRMLKCRSVVIFFYSYHLAISGNHCHASCRIRMHLFCLYCYWDSIKSYFTHFLLLWSLNIWPKCYDCSYRPTVTTQQAVLLFVFRRMTSSLGKSKLIIGCTLSDAFCFKIFLFFDIPQYSNRFNYIKDRRWAICFNNQKIIAYHL